MSATGMLMSSSRAEMGPVREHGLEVRNLTVEVVTSARRGAEVVRDVSIRVERKEVVALVGESGCGKTMTARAIMRLLPASARVKSGEIWALGANLLNLSPSEMRRMRATEVAIVFQHAQSALDPLMSVGDQIAETVRAHLTLSKREARERSIELLKQVGIPEPERRVDDYPFQFSGGMKQRVMIAMALSCEPRVLIADEPTTALDVSVQAQVLELLSELREVYGLTILIISHDLGLVADFADRVYIMYAGRVVESGSVDEVFDDPYHPYTELLIQATPRIGAPRFVTAVGATEDRNIPEVGCPFRPRCPHAFSVCASRTPTLDVRGPDRRAACWLER